MTVNPLPDPCAAASFDDFYRHYFPRVLMLLARRFPTCDAEDIAQETMARCYTRFATLEPARDAWPWVSSVARNAAIDSLRRNGRTISTDELPEPAGAAATDTTYDAVLVAERRRTVREALDRLRPADRQLIEDRELAGLDYTDMAAVRDITTNALRQQLFRARNRLAFELRRVNAALGVVPLAIQVRFTRLARRLDDVSAAAGPAGATALSIAAVAGVTTIATIFTTTAPGTPARTFPVIEADIGAAHGLSVPARRAATVPVAASGGGAALVAGPARPHPTPAIVIKTEGDPINDPGSPSGQEIRIPTPIGDVVYEAEDPHTPGYGILCILEVAECPPESPSPRAPAPAR